MAHGMPPIRKDKYHGKKFYVQYEEEDEELDRQEDIEEHEHEEDGPGDVLGMHSLRFNFNCKIF